MPGRKPGGGIGGPPMPIPGLKPGGGMPGGAPIGGRMPAKWRFQGQAGVKEEEQGSGISAVVKEVSVQSM